MKRKIILTIFILIFAVSISAQMPQEKNLLESVELKFGLQAEPSPQDVGFDNPQSSWKVKYELYLTDFSELERLGICTRDESNRHICPIINDKKISNKIKKKSLKIQKGNVVRRKLADERNREITVAVNLPPNIVEIFNRAVKIPEENPTFILIVTEKISTRNSAGQKFKEKYSITGTNQLKMADSNKTFDYWNVKNLSLNITIVKQADGKLRLEGGVIR